MNQGPTHFSKRIGSIDTLRGFAVLGILVMNIQSFSMPGAAYLNPHAFGSLEGLDGLVWRLSHLFADMKFMAIFSMLFGTGIVLMNTHREAAGEPVAGVHYRRMFVLLLVGLAHAYLFWYGDILVAYAITGMVIFLFRRRRVRTLLVVGLLFLAIPSAINLMAQWSMPQWPPGQAAQLESEWWLPGSEAIEEEIAIYTSSWTDQLDERIGTAVFMQTQQFLMEFFWRVAGLMLLGMALFKLGVLEARLPAARYALLAFFAGGVGFAIVGYGMHFNASMGWAFETSFFGGGEYNYWGSVWVALCYVAIVMLACRSSALAAITGPLAAVGRMAFSNYLLQTLVCTTIFYGHGFGLFGSVARRWQALITLAVWILCIVFSLLWLRRFRFGPAEWAWRCLTYWQIQPLRRRN